MNYYLDCEFIEYVLDGILHIELISIGFVSENNKEYYAINKVNNKSLKNANQWVKDNVLNILYNINPYRGDYEIKPELTQYYKSLDQIKTDILDYIGTNTQPRFWGEWCAYDHCALCSIFGSMMELPSNFPMRCRDIIQLAEDHLGISSNDLPESLETDGNHNALEGAMSVKSRFEWLLEQQKKLLLNGN